MTLLLSGSLRSFLVSVRVLGLQADESWLLLVVVGSIEASGVNLKFVSIPESEFGDLAGSGLGTLTLETRLAISGCGVWALSLGQWSVSLVQTCDVKLSLRML